MADLQLIPAAKIARVTAGFLTQLEAAKALHISRTQVSNLERGAIKSYPRRQLIEKLKEVYSVSERDVLLWFIKNEQIPKNP